jgi:HAD superfamily hydrolase (TIGR01509 family)
LITLYEGVEDSIKAMSQKHLLLGLLSNGSAKALERDVGHLFSYFQFTIAHAEKPETASFLAALKRLNILPQEAIYVGDAVSDIVLAKRAGSVSVALTCGMGTERHLLAAKPDYIYSSLKDFVTDLCQ